MFSADNHTGRLLEIRITSPFNAADAMALFKRISKVMPRDKGLALVFADLRGLRVVDPEVVEMVTGYTRLDNPYVERNAFLIGQSLALLRLQAARTVKRPDAPS